MTTIDPNFYKSIPRPNSDERLVACTKTDGQIDIEYHDNHANIVYAVNLRHPDKRQESMTPPTEACQTDAIVLDMMANTDCSYNMAETVLFYWLNKHISQPAMAYDNGPYPRSIKYGVRHGLDNEVDIQWVGVIFHPSNTPA